MTPLEKIIREKITSSGPMSVDEYIALCLYHPQHGYYMTHDPLGAKGDFITSPEISQLFGEMLALWAITTWQKMNCPAPFTLLECGPGRGTLMFDLLRAAKIAPEFLKAANICLLEISPVLKAKQQEKLAEYKVQWLNDVTELPPRPTLMIANEFFDAFPIKRFVNGQEQSIILENNSLVFNTNSEPTIETSPAIEKWMNQFCQHFQTHNGAACIIDYAYEDLKEVNSLQAMKDHQFVSVFEEPGECDLTAYVNYSTLRKVVEKHGLQATPTLTQRDFLMGYGFDLRLNQLLKSATPEQAETLKSGATRLIDPSGMGDEFKVMIIHKP